MDIRKWHERYSTDCRSKYNSLSTHSSYESGVKLFLTKFENYREPKEIPTQEIKEWLLTAKKESKGEIYKVILQIQNRYYSKIYITYR